MLARLRGEPADESGAEEKPDDMGARFEALARGAGQGATYGWGDEGAAGLMGLGEKLFGGPKDPDGIERNYSAGSRYQDNVNTMRADNAESERKYPGIYGTGQMAGGLPSKLAAGGALAGSGLAGVSQLMPAAGLAYGTMGGLEGAGNAEEGSRLQGAAQTAGPSALTAMAFEAAPSAAAQLKQMFTGGGGGPMGPLAPATAGASSSRIAPPRPSPSPVQINRSENMGVSSPPPPNSIKGTIARAKQQLQDLEDMAPRIAKARGGAGAGSDDLQERAAAAISRHNPAPRNAMLPSAGDDAGNFTIPKSRNVTESLDEMEKLGAAGDKIQNAGVQNSVRKSLENETKRGRGELPPINRDAEYYNAQIAPYEERVAERMAESRPSGPPTAVVGNENPTPRIDLGEMPEAPRPKTVNVRRPKGAAPKKGSPVQQELPLDPPEYFYHATPQSNKAGIAERGLAPEEGGKNFDFPKNRSRVYMSDEQHAPMWKQKLEDFSGEPALELRTTKPAHRVPGANEAVRIRTEPVPPERLEMREGGEWKPVSKPKPPAQKAASSEDELKAGRVKAAKERNRDPGRPPIQQEFADMNRPGKPVKPVDRTTASDEWAQTGYGEMRGADRGDKNVRPHMAKYAEDLKRQIDDAGVENPVLFRGMNFHDKKALNRALESGRLDHDAMSSWSTDPKVATEGFAKRSGGQGVVARVANQKGLPIHGLGHESEVVAPKGGYAIKQTSEDPDGTLQLLLEALGEAPQ